MSAYMDVREVFAGVLPDTGGEVIGMAEFADGGGKVLLVQFPLAGEDEEGEEDDTYCISTEKGICLYGGVDRIVLSAQGDRITFLLTNEASSTLGLPPALDARLHVPSAERATLFNAIGELFPTYGVVVETEE
jgi:hypothetical protein